MLLMKKVLDESELRGLIKFLPFNFVLCLVPQVRNFVLVRRLHRRHHHQLKWYDETFFAIKLQLFLLETIWYLFGSLSHFTSMRCQDVHEVKWQGWAWVECLFCNNDRLKKKMGKEKGEKCTRKRKERCKIIIVR